MVETDVERYRANLQAEVDGGALYRVLANLESTPELSAVYARMAESEDRHAAVWRAKLEATGATAGHVGPTWRTRVLIAVARRLGAGLVLQTVAAHERADSTRYAAQPEAVAAGMPADEQSHARLFQSIGRQTPSGLVGSALAQLEGRHPAASGNALRAAVLGANDGLVSNISLVMGVAGAELSPHSILITGLSGLLAGSMAMALGEWLSVQSARELYAHQIEIEARELEAFPEEEIEELTLIYRAKGVPEEHAREMASDVVADPKTALGTLAREELGINPEELGGSAWVASITSFFLFSFGAIIPVFPYFFTGGVTAGGLSIGLGALALFLIGAGITVITGRNALTSGLRQAAFGIVAACITFGIGRLVGVSLGA
ncbi:MAG TPA: VIT1/CCC1 transporter family protein [Thermomicrobiaceae bacterium]|nr:VIT1/CCC1 transporter family protein [Thermomicrobiaceae bacterium]